MCVYVVGSVVYIIVGLILCVAVIFVLLLIFCIVMYETVPEQCQYELLLHS